jgi:hypothetical protein
MLKFKEEKENKRDQEIKIKEEREASQLKKSKTFVVSKDVEKVTVDRLYKQKIGNTKNKEE